MLSEKGCQLLSSVNLDVVFVDGFSLYLFHPLLRLFTKGNISNADTSEQVLFIYLPLFMCVWRSEDGVCELFLSFSPRALGIKPGLSGLDAFTCRARETGLKQTHSPLRQAG